MTDHVEVLIVGAGPVGMALAMDLKWRGITPVVVESRPPGPPENVKSNHIAARTMEIFRRLGIVSDVRTAGLPGDYPHDVVFRTSFLGQELGRIPIPCRDDRYLINEGPDGDWPTPEPPHRLNSIFLEPIMTRHLIETFGVEVRHRTELLSFRQTDDDVIATLAGPAGEYEVRCRYLIGCDGARSTVRRALNIRFQGDPVILRVQATHLRAPELRPMLERNGGVLAWGNFSLNPRRSGMVYAIDGRERWLVFNYLRDNEPDAESVDRDQCIRQILGVGDSFHYDLISKQDWIGRRLIAERFRNDRVFICGDAAHVWVPIAGYGMNTGIADAMNLSWLLAAHIQGWAPQSILDAYEAERLPITEQVSRFAMNHALAVTRQRLAVPDHIEDDSEAGEAARQQVGEAAYELNVQQYCCAGLNFGYFYEGSPIIAYDSEPAPPYSMGTYVPSTAPGARLPHVWLRDGRSLYDVLGRGYTLLSLRSGADVAPVLAAAARAGVPIDVLDLGNETLPEPFRQAFVLVRPDHHIAWRGDAIPDDPRDLIDLARGARIARPATRTAEATAV